MSFDPLTLLDRLRLVNNDIGKQIDIIGAINTPPVLTRTIDGASTLEVSVADHRRELLQWKGLREKTWAVCAGMHFELVAVSKSSDTITLTFEDAIVAALRRRHKKHTFKAGKWSRAQIVTWIGKEAEVPVLVDPTHPAKIRNPIGRSLGGEKQDSWEFTGGDLISQINWRRFSDGARLVAGGDAWLVSGYKKPLRIREHTDGVGGIDFDCDIAKRASEAALTVDTRILELTQGTPVAIDRLGPASGNWLISEVVTRLTSTRAEVSLVRKTHVLDEPKKQKQSRDTGDRDFIPGQAATDPGGVANNPARERMVAWALQQRGKPYVFGASGPNSFDCSGLVQSATAVAGKTLGKPAASQWATCVAAGKTVPVATALGIRGALLFRINSGDYNHVAISLGNGTTMEAKGSAWGCNVFSTTASAWTGAALWL